MECHVTNRERESRSIHHLTRSFPPWYSSTCYHWYYTLSQPLPLSSDCPPLDRSLLPGLQSQQTRTPTRNQWEPLAEVPSDICIRKRIHIIHRRWEIGSQIGQALYHFRCHRTVSVQIVNQTGKTTLQSLLQEPTRERNDSCLQERDSQRTSGYYKSHGRYPRLDCNIREG